MAQVKNISDGPRGAYLSKDLVIAEVGEVIEADDFAPEWFEEVEASKPAKGKAAAEPAKE
jgi:hypothetical protein